MTNKLLIELRSIDLHVGLSEETPAYTAKVYVDGKHFADVSNRGHGGCDMVYPPLGGSHAAPASQACFRSNLAKLEVRIKATYPRHDYDHGPDFRGYMKESLEGLCHTQVWESVEKRNLKSRLSRKIIMIEDGKIYAIKGKRTPERVVAVAKQYPNATILNSVKFDVAFDLYKKYAA